MKDNMTEQDYQMQMLFDNKSKMEIDEIIGGIEKWQILTAEYMDM